MLLDECDPSAESAHRIDALQRNLNLANESFAKNTAVTFRQSESTGQTVEQVEKMFVARQPMGRLGTAEEVAMLAVYLASDESRFTTGTTSMVDGGWAL